jgi:hypothetical protein
VSEVFLGIIAIAVAVMAVIQVAAIVFAARAARSVGEAVSRLEQDVRPIVASLQTLSADAARATAAATAQVERAQKTVDVVLARVDSMTARLEQTVQAVHDGILAPAREGYAFMQAIRAIFSSVRSAAARPGARTRPAATEEEDALFIG